MLKLIMQSFVYLILFFSLFSCATVGARDTVLTMAWKAGPPTRHTVTYEFNLQGEFEDEQGRTKKLGQLTQYEAAYTQTISDHPDGLLVQQKDFKIAEPPSDGSEIPPSNMQLVIVKVSALLFASRPDYIMSPNGEFVGFHQFEKFAEIQNRRFEEVVGTPMQQMKQLLGSVVESAMDEVLLQAQVARDLSLIREWDQLSLSIKQPIARTITPAFTSKNKTDYMADGMLSYHGEHACNWKTRSGCVELQFNSNDQKVYDVQLVVEPDSLFPHSYRAQSQVSVQHEQNNLKMSNMSTVQYTHTVEPL